MDPNKAMDAATEGAKTITKLGEIIQKIFNPHWTRKQDQADAEADERRLKMIRDNPDLEVVFVNGMMSARQRTPEELYYHSEQRMRAQSIREEKNIEKVLEVAADDLKDSTTVSGDSVDDDWITRFLGIIKDINNEEMQYVWGKILAGEIKRPGSFSLRTLETIRNLSQDEAKTFQKIVPLIVQYNNSSFISAENELLWKYGITYDDIMQLDECGLVVDNNILSTGMTYEPGERHVLYTNHLAFIFENTTKDRKSIRMHVHRLTRAGQELSGILNYTSNEEYLYDFADNFYKKNSFNGIVANMYKISKITPTQIDYDLPSLREWGKPNQAD